MYIEEFKRYLHDKQLDPLVIEKDIDIIRQFSTFLSDNGGSIKSIEYDSVHDFSEYLIRNGMNSFD
ncbi:MAG: hypothetical protein ACFFEF_01235, partial [Candidatus Thorarchaeota archaeon]